MIEVQQEREAKYTRGQEPQRADLIQGVYMARNIWDDDSQVGFASVTCSFTNRNFYERHDCGI